MIHTMTYRINTSNIISPTLTKKNTVHHPNTYDFKFCPKVLEMGALVYHFINIFFCLNMVYTCIITTLYAKMKQYATSLVYSSLATGHHYCGALMFSLLLACSSCWTSSRVAGDLECHDAHVSSQLCFLENPLIWQWFFVIIH